MNLLPKSHQEFRQIDYWNTFFKKRGKKSFEWYGEYPELCEYLHKYIKTKDRILMVGCGNSKLSMDLYDVGFKDITNIDISQVVIKQMLDINRNNRAGMKFLHMDATAMNFTDEEFSVVLDKGTLDALMTDESDEVSEMVRKYFEEICRVLRNGGRYVCISLLQDHILKFLLDFFPNNNCMLRIVRCSEVEQKSAETSTDGQVMPVFVLIVTKFQQLSQKILEVCVGGDKMQRLSTTADVVETITSIQKAALVCNRLVKGSIEGLNEVNIDLYQPGFESARYTVYILDQPPKRENGKYAAFIVPQGREVEWLFSTPQGRKKLLGSAGHNRLAIVTMHRDQIYASWDDVKNELSQSMRNFAPHNLNGQIPYLSLGSDVGKRDALYKGYSEFSGDYIIEEVELQDGKLFRRLIFLNNQFVVQSEALVKTIYRKNKLPKKEIDVGYLACQHHLYMSVGVRLASMFKTNQKGHVLVIGLGGGGLCSFMHKVLRNVKITAVEIDAAMQNVAEKFFDLKQDSRLNVIIEDGISYLAKNCKSDKHFDAILFDVDCKDISLGMSCPPKNFLDSTVLQNAKTLIGNDGIFILNLVCRDEVLREEAVKSLKDKFKSICLYKLDEDVNEIVYCCNKYKSIHDWKNTLEGASKDLNELVKKIQFDKSNGNMIDIDNFLNDLKV